MIYKFFYVQNSGLVPRLSASKSRECFTDPAIFDTAEAMNVCPFISQMRAG
jgi:hypothetical protein